MPPMRTSSASSRLTCSASCCAVERCAARDAPSKVMDQHYRGLFPSQRHGACHLQAIKLMKSQQDGGHIFLMDGAGADGNATPRFAAYGASKRGLAQLRKSLQVATLAACSCSTARIALCAGQQIWGLTAGRAEAAWHRECRTAQPEPRHGHNGASDEW